MLKHQLTESEYNAIKYPEKTNWWPFILLIGVLLGIGGIVYLINKPKPERKKEKPSSGIRSDLCEIGFFNSTVRLRDPRTTR